MSHTLKELSTARTMQQLCEYGDKRIAELEAALRDIAALDPHVDSSDGFNEWGECDCFRQAKDKARAALGEPQ